MKHNAKRTLSLFLVLAALLSLLTAPAAQAWDGAAVSAPAENGGVYEIENSAQLAWVAQQVNQGNDFAGKTVRLTQDIDLKNQNWTPIGKAEPCTAEQAAAQTDEGGREESQIDRYQGYAFAGTFDGGGCTISNLYINDAGGYVGLFGYMIGTVRNLTVSGTVCGADCTAGIAAVGCGTFEKVTNRVTVVSEGNCVGGILGDASGNIQIVDCHNQAVLTNNGNPAEKSTGRIGGMVGRVETFYSGTVTRCSNTADLTGYQYIGGMIGGCFGNVAVSACYNTGTLTGISFGKIYMGGIVGKLESGTVDSCYNWGDINVNCWADGHTRYAAGIVGSEEDHEVGAAITNCYNIGTINIDTSKKTYGSKFIYASGGVSGGNQATAANTMSYANCFYLEGCVPSQDPNHESYQFWCDVWKNNPKAYDTDGILSKTMDELKGQEVLEALGGYFIEVSGSYPILYWQDPNGSTPPVRSFGITFSVSGGTAAVTVPGEAEEGSEVRFAVGKVADGKQIKRVSVVASSGAEVPCVLYDGSYTFTMPSRAVSIVVLLENCVADDAASYRITLPEELDAIWDIAVDSTYYNAETGTVKEGASVVVSVRKEDKALTSSFTGISVTSQDGGTIAAAEQTVQSLNGSNYYGEYAFTMPGSDVEVSLDAVYSDLSVYVKQDGVSTLQKAISRAQMTALAEENGLGYYSGWSSETQAYIGVAEQYITLEQVLEYSGITLDVGDSISVTTPDGFEQSYSYAQLSAERSCYADILEQGARASEGTPFGYAFVLKGNMAFRQAEIDDVVCDTLNAYRFVYGQTEDELTGSVKCVDSMPKSVISLTVNKVAAQTDITWYSAEQEEFVLTTAAQLRGLASIVNATAYGADQTLIQDDFTGKTVRLGGDIALAEDGLYTAIPDVRYGTAGYAITTTQYVLRDEAAVWTPIGSGTAYSNSNVSGKCFAGTFDGCGYTVSGLYTGVKDPEQANTETVQGLFGIVSGTVKNVTVSGCVTAKGVAGGVAAYLDGGSVTDCVNQAVIFTDGGTTPNGNTENGIEQFGAVGGIVGNALSGSTVTDCVNYAGVTAANSKRGGRAGGIIGLINSENDTVTVARCTNHGFVDAYQYAGGIVGANFSAKSPLTECSNTGRVWAHSGGQAYAGGITAYSDSDITDCYNTGEVGIHQQGNANDKCAHFGGILSDFGGTAIRNCYNVGALTYSIDGVDAPLVSSFGGICGTGYGNAPSESKLLNCYVLSGQAYENTGYLSEKTETGLTAGFAATLGDSFVNDKTGINNGYPVLRWQAAGGDPFASVWDGETIDIRWFTKDPDAEEFYITYPAEFAGLAALVNGIYNEDIKYIYGEEAYIVDQVTSGTGTSGGNNEATDAYHYGAYDFSGKTIYLCADIDMGRSNNYMPIGGQYLMTDEDTSTKIGSSFCGTLDGQGHNVTIYCDRHCSGNYGDGQSVGLIGRLGCHDNDPSNMWPSNAGVRNLAVYGSVRGNRSVGGVVGKIGKTNGGATIECCANYASVTGTDAKGTGGIVGAAWNGGVIQNCYNSGTVTSTFTNAVAGIAGSCEIAVINCYNVGTVTGSRTTTAAIASHNGGMPAYQNCYWLEGSADVGVYGGGSAGVTTLNESEMKSDGFAILLGESYNVDSDNINSGYPVLAWQGGSKPSAGTTVPVEDVVDNRTGDANAVVTGPEGGFVVDGTTENTFTVSSTGDVACVVLVATTDDEGNVTYERLSANNTDGVHSFTTALSEGQTIVVAVKGDVSGDGAVTSRDAMMLNSIASGTLQATALQAEVGHIGSADAISSRDAMMANTVAAGSMSLNW